MNWDDQVALDAKHAEDPQPGDYWEDHFCGVLQVLAVTHGMVIFFDKKIDVDDDHWAWDATKPSALTVPEFAKKLRYNTPNLANKTWANVHPRQEMAT